MIAGEYRVRDEARKEAAMVRPHSSDEMIDTAIDHEF
jgi:hypothetical protein